MNKTIHVLDSIPGTRKTSGAIDYINANPNKHILYICEYKSEIDRVCEATHCVQPESVYDETLEAYHSKRDDIKKLLIQGECIASSHALFINFDDEILTVIKRLKYEIILDEVVTPVTNIVSHYNIADYNTLAKTGHILSDPDTGQISWNWEIEPESVYDELRGLVDTGNIYKAGIHNQFLYILPVGLFTCASKVTVMTYNFKGCLLYNYFLDKGFDIKDETDIKCMDGSNLKQHVKDHIVFVRHRMTDRMREYMSKSYRTNGYTLSYTCYNKHIRKFKDEDFKKFIGSRINLITRHILQKYDTSLSISDLMYTFPMGYSGVQKEEKESKGVLHRKKIYRPNRSTIQVRDISELKCFVPLNCRGTNEYADKAILVHCYNQFACPAIKSYYDTFTRYELDQDEMALNTLIQWIFRSRIRNYIHGEKIYVYCLSERMERILKNWVDSL